MKPTDHILFRNSHVPKSKMHHVCTVHTKQTIRLYYPHPVRLPWDNQGADSRSRRLRRVSDRENKKEIGNSAVSNETLLSVEDKISGFTFCARFDGASVGPSSRLR